MREVRFQVQRGVAAVAIAAFLSAALGASPATAQERKPLTKNEVMELLESGVPPNRVGELARQFGVSFPMTAQTETQLVAAGASEELLKILRPLAPQPPPAAAKGAATALLIEVTPGGAQVYVNDEPVGTTSAQGRLRLSRLPAGEHRVRLALAGYGDLERVVELTPGTTEQISGMLETAPGSANPLAGDHTSFNPLAQPSGEANPLAGGSAATPAAQSAADLPRFRIAHDHGGGGTDYCTGWLTLAAGRIQFQADNGQHSFEIPVSGVERARKNAVYLRALGAFHIRLKEGANFNLILINEANQPQPPDTLLTLIAAAMSMN